MPHLRRIPCCAAVLVATAALGASAAQAANLFTLEPSHDSVVAGPGSVAVDGTGTGYFAWLRRVPPAAGASRNTLPVFCKIPRGSSCAAPITLALPHVPSAAPLDQYGSGSPFVLLGSGTTVYVVAPSYISDTTVIWTSTDGGASFGAAAVSGYSNKTGQDDVLLDGSTFDIAATNVGVGFNQTPVTGDSNAFHNEGFTFGPGGDAASGALSSTLALAAAGRPVDAWQDNLSGAPPQLWFSAYSGAGAVNSAGSWSAPAELDSAASMPRLASGPAGVFLLSSTFTAVGAANDSWQVRKWTGSGFAAPVTVADGARPSGDVAGGLAESSTGELLVAIPTKRAEDGALVMRAYASTDGIHWSAPTDIANLANLPEQAGDVRLAVAPDGQGYASFDVGQGLQVADFTPIAPATTTTTTSTTTTTTTTSTSTSTTTTSTLTKSRLPGGPVSNVLSVGRALPGVTVTVAHPRCFLPGRAFVLRVRAHFRGHGGPRLVAGLVLLGRRRLGSLRGPITLTNTAGAHPQLTLKLSLRPPHRHPRTVTAHWSLSVC